MIKNYAPILGLLSIGYHSICLSKPEFQARIVCYPTADERGRREADFKVSGFKTTNSLEVIKEPFLPKTSPGVCVAYTGFDEDIDKKQITTYLWQNVYKPGVTATAAPAAEAQKKAAAGAPATTQAQKSAAAAPATPAAGPQQKTGALTAPVTEFEIALVLADEPPKDVNSILKGGTLLSPVMDHIHDSNNKEITKKGYWIQTPASPFEVNKAVEQITLVLDPPAILKNAIELLKK